MALCGNVSAGTDKSLVAFEATALWGSTNVLLLLLLLLLFF